MAYGEILAATVGKPAARPPRLGPIANDVLGDEDLVMRRQFQFSRNCVCSRHDEACESHSSESLVAALMNAGSP